MDKSISYRAGISNKSISLDSVAITEWDKEAWITLLSRLSARGLGQPEPSTKDHIDPDTTGMGNSLRERLFEYIMINFRDHMDLAIAWLTEEWYNDKLTSESSGVYAKWATRIFDNILPFIEGKDMRIFIRFLGDLPLIMPAHVNKLRILCLDPERQKLGFAAIKYLLLLRPPARIACIELCTDLHRNRIVPLEVRL
jgi:symplekin